MNPMFPGYDVFQLGFNPFCGVAAAKTIAARARYNQTHNLSMFFITLIGIYADRKDPNVSNENMSSGPPRRRAPT